MRSVLLSRRTKLGGGLPPVTTAALTSAGSGTDATSYTTASITPSGLKLVRAAIESSVTSGTPNIPTLTGNGFTWVLARSVALGTRRLSVFRAMGAAPTAGTVTIDFAGQTQTGITWGIAEFGNVDTSGTNGSGAVVQSNDASGAAAAGALSVSLSAFGSPSNATFGAFARAQNDASFVAGSGFTKLVDVGHTSPSARLMTEWRPDNATTVNATWTGTADALGIALEVKAGT